MVQSAAFSLLEFSALVRILMALGVVNCILAQHNSEVGCTVVLQCSLDDGDE